MKSKHYSRYKGKFYKPLAPFYLREGVTIKMARKKKEPENRMRKAILWAILIVIAIVVLWRFIVGLFALIGVAVVVWVVYKYYTDKEFLKGFWKGK